MGRSPDNDVIFTQLDRAVGRHHAVLEFQNGQIALRDLNSRYGSFINDRKVGTAPVILNSGDMVRLGTRTTLKFIKIMTSPSSGPETTNIGALPKTEMEVEETIMVKEAPDIEKTVRVVRLGKNKTGK
jgi:pSer/pThr/pTyr-binding forkhead associated (FHA) protein